MINKISFARFNNMHEVVNFFKLPPLSLYVHIPWCIKKCPYCDFNSYSVTSIKSIDEDLFFQTLQLDLEQALPFIWGRKIISVFLGGGTPSILSEYTVDKILNMIRKYLPLIPNAEIVLEANPSSIDFKKFVSFSKSGINRFSLGIQSFDDKFLKILGRSHSSNDAKKAIDIAQKTDARVNLDIMFALPNQTIEESLLDIQQALSYNTEHLSIYHLTIEPNTNFYKSKPILPNEDIAMMMENNIEKTMFNHNFEQYEVSAYAKNKKYSIHNMNYWTFGDYLGIGPGAHSKISNKNCVIREVRAYNPKLWTKLTNKNDKSHIVETKILNKKDLIFEFMLNVLRLKNGIDITLFQQRTGLNVTEIMKKIQTANELNLLEINSTNIKPTLKGWKFLNDLQSLFL
ncbi:Oxygen-independent coproporphyrinogen-III oxidase-like protein YqeR [Candidatus Kinetoplastibacterium sorsogonicusi]|uniref:Heme chaperone HemW n=1 Tax=Candidatus Kinetoplastidibacterium kentomonadis TaxID=1576550 RepID=A0A3Q8EY66_9PROT|nr:radical SAM family heme chaperone HemW [Candidatus Kinetoplastibacterium sorsogonicusi]AWD32456.1 Oxygen-independent coproporphyrinogen-III oxidase-like protein YqeR [Candidatus Kinetoplastibacterium sorsogonicusi]